MPDNKDAMSLGRNRTGIDMSPLDAEAMNDAVQSSGTRPSTGDAAELNNLRAFYLQEADPVGTVALPGSFKGLAKTVMHKLKGDEPAVLIDKLGERLAFERSGVRMYELFIAKCEAHPLDGVSIPLTQLHVFQREEAEHFAMLSAAIEALGADPTSITPSADTSGVMAQGIMQVLSDPRTTVAQSLEAMLNIELLDNHAWDSLIQLANDLSMADLVKKLQRAQRQELVHLQTLKDIERNLLGNLAAS